MNARSFRPKASPSTLVPALALLCLPAIAAAGSIGLNFCDGWPLPHVSGAPADGFDGWTDSRGVGDWTDPAAQDEPMALGGSGVSATWAASNTWSAGAEGDNEQALYRVYLDDGQTSPGTGVRVTITGLAQWLAGNGLTSYQVRCYASSDNATAFRPVTIRYGAAADGPVLHTMTPAVLGGGGYPTDRAQGGPAARGFAESPPTLGAGTITITLPPRYGTLRGTLAAVRITGFGPASVPQALARDRWGDLVGWTLADLTRNRPRYLGPPSETTVSPAADPAAPAIDEAGHGDAYATRHRGFLAAPVTGWYRFWITGDDEAELWLADGSVVRPCYPSLPASGSNPPVPYTNRFGKRLVAGIRDERAGTTWTAAGDFDRFPSQRSAPVHLAAGQSCYIEVLHKEGDGPDHVALAWQVPGKARALVPASAMTSDALCGFDLDSDFLPDAWEEANGLDPADNGLVKAGDGQYGDLDGDGLDNLTEFQLGTRPDLADTDGDEIDDRTERDLYHTNPLVSNKLAYGPATAIPPHRYTSSSLRWIRDFSGSLTAMDRRGEISYSFEVSADPSADLQPGVIQVTLAGGAAGLPRAIERLPLVFSIDGRRFAADTLVSPGGATASVTALTPWLAAGPHVLTILHDNFRAARALRIDSITLRNLGGEDLDENGTPDWLDQRLAADNRLTRCPSSSLASPVCIEGVTPDLAGLSLLAGGVAAAPVESIDSGFYADIPLDETGAPVSLDVSFQSGALAESRAIGWAAADLSALDSIDIRQGDSLRLDASTSGHGNDQNFGTYSVRIGSTYILDAAGERNHKPGFPVKATFDTPGTHTLSVDYNGNRPGRTVTLRVHEASFGPALGARAHFPRDWAPPSVGRDAVVQPDSRIAWAETTPATAAARTFRVNSTVPGERHVLARLPEDVAGAPGAILARGTVNTFYLAYLDETGDIAVIHTYPDGTRLMRGSIVAVGLPPGVAIRLNTYYQGTVFLDGSNTLWLAAGDFGPNGVADLFFEWAGQGDPYVCTYVDLFTTTPP